MYLLYKFDDSARHVLAVAKSIAVNRESSDAPVRTEHVLLALVQTLTQEGMGSVKRVFEYARIDTKKIVNEIEKVVNERKILPDEQSDRPSQLGSRTRFFAEVENIIVFANESAKDRTYVDPEDLLLGLMERSLNTETQSTAYRILIEMGLTSEKIREAQKQPNTQE